jgi:hypothetical protein
MKKSMQWIASAWMIVLLMACSNTTKMTRVYVDDNRIGTPVKDVLVIAVIDEAEIREVFETHFMKRLTAVGVEAITSADVLPIGADTKLQKEAILNVIDEHGNDTVAITHLVGLEESEVFSRSIRRSPMYYRDYYRFYIDAWDYVHAPTVYGEHIQISLETRLYDVKTESLIWVGESQTMDPKTTGQAIGQVVDAVMNELKNNGLLPESK